MIPFKKIGALTSKVYAFKARPWETSLIKSIDICDSLGSPVSVETKGAKILRVLPRYNRHLQIEWCSDKARYIHETNDKHRLANPSALNKKGRFQPLNSLVQQKKISMALLASFSQLDVVVGRYLDNNTLYNAKLSARVLGGDCLSEFPNKLSKTFAFSYASVQKLSDLESFKSILLLGVNPRWETTIANLLLRFRFLNGNFHVNSVGNPVDLTYPAENYGSSFQLLHNISIGKHTQNQNLDKNTLYAYGDSLSQRHDAISLHQYGAISNHIGKYKSLFLSCGANAVGLAHLAIGEWKHKNSTYFVGADNAKSLNLVENQDYLCETPFVHKSIKKAFYLQPMQTYLEKNAHYIRYDGVVQTAHKALNFGVTALKPILGTSTSIKQKSFFSSLKKPKKNKYFLNIHTCGIFQILCAKDKHLKIKLTCMKSFYGNMYNSFSFLKTSPTLLQLAKLQNKMYWHFI